MEELEEVLEKALNLETQGNLKEASICYDQSLESHPSSAGLILFQMASFLFRQGNHEDALHALIKSYINNFQRAETEKIILEAYHAPNKQNFLDTFNKNINALSNYKHFNKKIFPSFNSLIYRFVPFSETSYAIFDNNKKIFISNINFSQSQIESGYNSDDILLIKNEFNIEKLSVFEKDTKNKNADQYVTTNLPLYLVYDNERMFFEFLQISSFYSLVENERVVFLFGHDEVKECFNSETAIFPSQYLNMNGKDDAYWVSIEQLKQKLITTENIGYQNLMTIFKQSFNPKK